MGCEFREVMEINIIGKGTIGYGIYSLLSRYHKVKIYGSEVFDNDTLEFTESNIFDCDLFVHAAGVTDELVDKDFEYAVYKSNGFIKYLAKNLNKSKCTKIVYISSIHVFGNLVEGLSNETRPDPNSLYALFHLNAEKCFEIFLKNTDISLLSLRIPTIYGFPKERDKINRPKIIQFSFLLSLIHSNEIILNSSGEQFRLFSSNIKVGAVINAWIADKKKTQFAVDVVQGTNITVKGFAESCIKTFQLLTSSKAKLILPDFPNKPIACKKIIVEPVYDCKDEYALDQFLIDFLQNYLK